MIGVASVFDESTFDPDRLKDPRVTKTLRLLHHGNDPAKALSLALDRLYGATLKGNTIQFPSIWKEFIARHSEYWSFFLTSPNMPATPREDTEKASPFSGNIDCLGSVNPGR